MCAEGRAPRPRKNAFSGRALRGNGWKPWRDVSVPAQDAALAFHDRFSADPRVADGGGCLLYGVGERSLREARSSAGRIRVVYSRGRKRKVFASRTPLALLSFVQRSRIPSSSENRGAYPSNFCAFEISATEWTISPGRCSMKSGRETASFPMNLERVS